MDALIAANSVKTESQNGNSGHLIIFSLTVKHPL
jgi:hypothetical protein